VAASQSQANFLQAQPHTTGSVQQAGFNRQGSTGRVQQAVFNWQGSTGRVQLSGLPRRLYRWALTVGSTSKGRLTDG
jgi:hypothetical protein